MADLMDLILTRRSIRQYTEEPIPAEKLEKVVEAGLSAPSGRGRKPWELVVVQDKATLEKLSHCREQGAGMLAGAAACIVVVGKKDVSTVIEDCSILMAYMQLEAHAQGLASCWIQGRMRTAENGTPTETYVEQILQIPEETYQLEAILSLGIAQDTPPAHTLDEIDRTKIHYETF